MKRRDFIKGATVGAGVLASGMLPAKGLAGTSSNPGNTFGNRMQGVGFRKIDAFCHFVPMQYLQYLYSLTDYTYLRTDLEAIGSNIPEHSDISAQNNGGWDSSGFPKDPAAAYAPRLQMMDDMGIDVSIIFPQPDIEGGLISQYSPFYGQGSPSNAALAAIYLNNYMSKMCSEFPQFKFVALLPFTSTSELSEEFSRVTKLPGVVGVGINTGPLTSPPDDLIHQSLYQMAAENNVPVWIHLNRGANSPDYVHEPTDPYAHIQLSYDFIWLDFGFLMDGSADMMRLAGLKNPASGQADGVFNLFPGLKLVVHQRGHLISLYKDRIRMHFEVFNNILTPPVGQLPLGSGAGQFDMDNFMNQLSQFYVDAISSGEDSDLLTRAVDFFGADHVLYATDTAYSPNGGRYEAQMTSNSVLGLQVTKKVKQNIFARNVEAVINKTLV